MMIIHLQTVTVFKLCIYVAGSSISNNTYQCENHIFYSAGGESSVTTEVRKHFNNYNNKISVTTKMTAKNDRMNTFGEMTRS